MKTIKPSNRILLEDCQNIAIRDAPWSKLRGKIVLVTGACGFLARHLIRFFDYLSTANGMAITVKATTRNPHLASQVYADNASVKIIDWDLAEPNFSLGAVDFVIHMASAASPLLFSKEPLSAISPNTVGTTNVIKSIQIDRLENFLYMSTSGVYGFLPDSKRPNSESTFGVFDHTLPESVYLQSKRMGETISLAWCRSHSLPATIVRPSICYGHGVPFNDGRSFADFIAALVLNKNIVLETDGEAYRNYCYVSDVVAGILLVLLKGGIGEAFNLATDDEIKIKNLAYKLVHEVFPDKNLKVIFRPKKESGSRVQFMRTQVDCSKIKELGWSEFHSINDGFERTVESYQ